MQQSKDEETLVDTSGTGLETLEKELSVFVRRAAAHYLGGQAGQAGEEPLDGWRYPLLVRLAEGGPQRSAELARVFGLNRSTLGRHLARMEETGLVCRVDGRRQGATSAFFVTDTGRVALVAARRARMGPLRTLLDTWPEAERRELARLLARLNHDLDARAPGVRPRQRQSGSE
ncbi:MAG: MarR family transcriptional regulator [Actinomycetota bacterium]|nr:MarR family transcriptional regulator [Actinomycetota bacterium]